MGLFPSDFSPKHLICKDSSFKGTIFVRGVFILRSKTIREIDEWVGDNITSNVYYVVRWPKGDIWHQCFYFSNTEDAMAFKLRWS